METAQAHDEKFMRAATESAAKAGEELIERSLLSRTARGRKSEAK